MQLVLKPKERELYFFKKDTAVSRCFSKDDDGGPGGGGGNAEVDGVAAGAAVGVKPNPRPLAVCVMARAFSYCCSCISNNLAEPFCTLLGVSDDGGGTAQLLLLIPIKRRNFSFVLSLPKLVVSH